LAAILGGALFAAAWIITAAGGSADVNLTARWVGLPAHILILLGLVGVYVVQSEATGPVGFVGFLLAFATTAIIIGFIIGGNETPLPEPVLGPPAGLGWAVGFILLAFATAVGGQLAPWPAITAAIGAVIYIAGMATSSALLGPVGGVVFAVGFAWAGVQLWS
jgi:hypothetical protein